MPKFKSLLSHIFLIISGITSQVLAAPVSFNVSDIKVEGNTRKIYYPIDLPANRTLIIDNSTVLPPQTNSSYYDYITAQFVTPGVDAAKAKDNNLIVQITQQSNTSTCFTGTVADYQPLVNNGVFIKDSIFSDGGAVAAIGFGGNMQNNHVNVTNVDSNHDVTGTVGFLQLLGVALLNVPLEDTAIFNANSINASRIYVGRDDKEYNAVWMTGFSCDLTRIPAATDHSLTSQAHGALTKPIEIANNTVTMSDIHIGKGIFAQFFGSYYNDSDRRALRDIITHHNSVIINDHFNTGLNSEAKSTVISGTAIKGAKVHSEDHRKHLLVRAYDNLVSLGSGMDHISAKTLLFIAGADVTEVSDAARNQVVIKGGRFKGERIHIRGAFATNSHLGHQVSDNSVNLDGGIFRSDDFMIIGGHVLDDVKDPETLHTLAEPLKIANNTLTISRCDLDRENVYYSRFHTPYVRDRRWLPPYEGGRMGRVLPSLQIPATGHNIPELEAMISGAVYCFLDSQFNSVPTVNIVGNKVHFTRSHDVDTAWIRGIGLVSQTRAPTYLTTISGARAVSRIPYSMVKNGVLIEEGRFINSAASVDIGPETAPKSTIAGAITPMATIINDNFVKISRGTFGGVDIIGVYVAQDVAPGALDALPCTISGNCVQIAGGVFENETVISAVVSAKPNADIHDNFVKIINNNRLNMTGAKVVGACAIGPELKAEDLTYRLPQARNNRLIIDSRNNTNLLAVNGAYLFNEFHFILPPVLNSLSLLDLHDPKFLDEQGKVVFEKVLAFSLYEQIERAGGQYPLLTVANRLDLRVNDIPTDISLDISRVSEVNTGDWIVLVDGSAEGIDYFETKLDNGFLIFNFKSEAKDLILAVAMKAMNIRHNLLMSFIDLKFMQDQRSRHDSASGPAVSDYELFKLLDRAFNIEDNKNGGSKQPKGKRRHVENKSKVEQSLEALHLVHNVKLSSPGALILSQDLQPNKHLAFAKEKLDASSLNFQYQDNLKGLMPYPYNARSKSYNLAPRTQAAPNNDMRIATSN